jgi:hypothetical protein
VLSLFQIHRLSTSAYHPRTNGLTERFNHTLCTMLTHFTNLRQNDWDTYIPFVLLAYRSAPQKSTGISPFFALYGRNPRFPIDTLLSSSSALSTHHLDNSEAAEYMIKLVERLRLCHRQIIKKKEQETAERHEVSEAMTKVPLYKLGQLVLVHTPAVKKGRTKKLSALWKGPYKIVQAFANKVNYRVQLLDKDGQLHRTHKIVLVHVSRIKPYYGAESARIRLGEPLALAAASSTPLS